VGVSTSVNWPIGLGGNGNNGVAGLIVQNPYSIGYVEYTYAILNGMNYAAIRNAAGNFILPDVQSISKAAAAAALSLPRGDQSWSQVSIIKAVVNDTQAADAYPVTSFTYVLVYKDLSVVPGMTLEKAKAMIQFLWWAVHDGQSYAQPLAYVPLPPPVVSLDETTLRSIQFNGQAVMP
jgi:ABC-type phosphate transport system substrate-binding protein